MFTVTPVTLAGRHVRLEPIRMEHAEALCPHAMEPDIWLYMPYGPIDSPERVRWWVGEMLRKQREEGDLPFVTIDIASGLPIGATRFMDVQPKHRGLEIGGTWLGKAYRRTAANTEAKYLMLRHAFEVYGCVRVQIKTDTRNERSQRAIERLGFVREGVLRKNMIMPDGYVRSSVYYSVTDDEWPAMKARLEGWLDGG